MRLLFDQNLSRKLVPRFDDDYPHSAHVDDVDLGTATDDEIWAYAREHGYVIVSKDSDFRQLAFLHGPPPKAIWIRVGNSTTEHIAKVIDGHRGEIEAFVANQDEALLIIE